MAKKKASRKKAKQNTWKDELKDLWNISWSWMAWKCHSAVDWVEEKTYWN